MNADLGRWLLMPAIAALLSVSLLLVLTAPRTEAQSQDNSQDDASTASENAQSSETNGASREKPEIFEAPGTEPSGSESPGSLSAAQKRAIFEQGYLVPDQAAYEQAKENAAAEAQQSSGEESASSTGTLALQNVKGFNGIFDTRFAPSDSTGAVGTSRYIELVNAKFAIYDTNGSTIKTGSLKSLVGAGRGHSVFDPQIIWDPGTQRFFYVADDVVSAGDNRLVFGFSKTDSPSSAADFCKYVIPFGSRFTDYPKLGDTQDLVLIGTSSFNGFTESFLGSDLYSITKPASGSTCPAASTFTIGQKQNLKDSTGTEQAFTPVPANQTDPSGTGWVVARPLTVPNTRLLVYQVTKNANGTLNVGTAKDQAVPPYDVPANAAQKGTTKRLDTLDARNTQAVSAIDPSLGVSGVEAVWTQHTVFGGHGAEVRWYKINPDDGTPAHNPVLLDSDIVTDPSTYYFNGAISPDRKVNGTTRAFGSNMVLGFNGSSETQFPDIRMVSKIGAAPQSPPVVVKNSKFALSDFSCKPQPCRWGDYAAATPDPGASDAETTGQVWLTSQFVRTKKGSGSKWGSFNWIAKP